MWQIITTQKTTIKTAAQSSTLNNSKSPSRMTKVKLILWKVETFSESIK